MIPTALRNTVRELINEAVAAGARLYKACAVVGLTARCLQRWREDGIDRRSTRVQTPQNALDPQEVEAILATANSPEFAHLPPTQIVPRLADQGVYLASESTFYRALRRRKQLRHRRLERQPQQRALPRALVACGPNQVASWDITYLPSTVRGQYWFLYVVLDLFSRKAVAWQVYANESQVHASDLIRDYVSREGISPNQLTLHADNGPVMKGAMLYATLQELKIAPSHSRASVSDDNPFIESLFKTIKYRPENPLEPFPTLSAARQFADQLMAWYNHEHHHSEIGYVTPDDRHQGRDIAILKQRNDVYERARQNHPKRWSRGTRDWSRKDTVHLNPRRVEKIGKPDS